MNYTMNNFNSMTSNYEPIDAETLLATPLPPVRWVIPGLLPAGLSLLAGASMGFVLPQGNPSPRRTTPPIRGWPRRPAGLVPMGNRPQGGS